MSSDNYAILRCSISEVPVKPATVVIKKYPNRRLYDTSSSTYVNLDDIAKLIRNGTDVKISDAETGEDITRVVLTQIIVEDAKEQPTGLPVELLKQLIVAGDHVGREFIMWYLRSAFDAGARTVQRELEDTAHVTGQEIEQALQLGIEHRRIPNRVVAV